MPGSMFVGSGFMSARKELYRRLTAQMLHSIRRPGKNFRAEFKRQASAIIPPSLRSPVRGEPSPPFNYACENCGKKR